MIQVIWRGFALLTVNTSAAIAITLKVVAIESLLHGELASKASNDILFNTRAAVDLNERIHNVAAVGARTVGDFQSNRQNFTNVIDAHNLVEITVGQSDVLLLAGHAVKSHVNTAQGVDGVSSVHGNVKLNRLGDDKHIREIAVGRIVHGGDAHLIVDPAATDLVVQEPVELTRVGDCNRFVSVCYYL